MFPKKSLQRKMKAFSVQERGFKKRINENFDELRKRFRKF